MTLKNCCFRARGIFHIAKRLSCGPHMVWHQRASDRERDADGSAEARAAQLSVTDPRLGAPLWHGNGARPGRKRTHGDAVAHSTGDGAAAIKPRAETLGLRVHSQECAAWVAYAAREPAHGHTQYSAGTKEKRSGSSTQGDRHGAPSAQPGGRRVRRVASAPRAPAQGIHQWRAWQKVRGIEPYSIARTSVTHTSKPRRCSYIDQAELAMASLPRRSEQSCNAAQLSCAAVWRRPGRAGERLKGGRRL
jgi:hypothetical protein